jgi:hypothetical protein
VRLPSAVSELLNNDTERMWESVVALCARAACVHIENAGLGWEVSLCDPKRFTDKTFPQLRALKFRDDAYEFYSATF